MTGCLATADYQRPCSIQLSYFVADEASSSNDFSYVEPACNLYGNQSVPSGVPDSCVQEISL